MTVQKVTVKCDGCGNDFQKLPLRLREKNYCQRLCKDLAGRKDKTAIVCQSCGKTFHVIPSRARKAKFCSDPCKFEDKKKTLDDRRAEFWSYVDIRGPDECWPWLGTTRSGYGRFWTKDGHITAHVESYEQTNGRVDAVRGTQGVVLRHVCDNRICVNPSHVIPGTQAQNVQDMVERGRSTKGRLIGESNHESKLTEEQVLAIRKDERTHRSIAEDYGVSHTLVRYIKHRRAWAYLE